MNTQEIKKTVLQQMKNYLNGTISKEDYARIAEEFYTKYGHCIAGTDFHKIFSENIPDCCIINVDEPGNEDKKERDFQKIMKDTYKKLLHLM